MQIAPSQQQSPIAGVPKHERLRVYLLNELSFGRLKAGDALPTEWALAISAEVSRNTVRHALGALERGGLIRRVRGSGTFVHESAMERLRSDSDIFALVIPDTRGGYYPSLQRGFHTATTERHAQGIICDRDNDHFRQADALLQLIDKKIAGVAIVPTTTPPTPAHQLRPLQERGIPIVFCHRRVEGIQAPLVSFSGSEVGKMAGQAMIEKGHRRAAFIGFQRARLANLYEQGLREALAGNGGELPEKFVRFDDSPKLPGDHERFLKENLAQLIREEDRPTAIFCPFDSETESVYLQLNQMGVKIPEEISLISFGEAWREDALTRRLTAVTVDEEKLGQHAGRLLDEIRRHEKPLNGLAEMVMPLGWADGETLGPAPIKQRAVV